VKIKIVPAKELTSKDLRAKTYVLGPERKAVISFQAETTIKFHGNVGEDDYERAVAAFGAKAKKIGIHIGSFDSVEEKDE
jgi:hypothetical protein